MSGCSFFPRCIFFLFFFVSSFFHIFPFIRLFLGIKIQPTNQKFTAILKVETLIKIHCIKSRHQCVVNRRILERLQLKENHRFQFREFVSVCVTKTISNLRLFQYIHIYVQRWWWRCNSLSHICLWIHIAEVYCEFGRYYVFTNGLHSRWCDLNVFNVEITIISNKVQLVENSRGARGHTHSYTHLLKQKHLVCCDISVYIGEWARFD